MAESKSPSHVLPTDDDSDPSDPSGPASGNAPASAASAADPVAEARAETAKMKEAWMRSAADFDNFRKRSRRELEDARKGGREEILKDLLPVFDNLERGIQSAQQAPDVKAVTDGLQMIIKQFESTLGKMGISKVGTVGKSFDPGIHEAIQQVETSDHPAGTVVAEVQPGYMAGEKLIRAAMVVVAKPKAAESAESN
jgi:molecular chaperone GrpE